MNIAGIKAGDIVRVDKKGRVFEAFVDAKPADGVVPIAPISQAISYRSATAREVICHWSKCGRPRATAPTALPHAA